MAMLQRGILFSKSGPRIIAMITRNYKKKRTHPSRLDWRIIPQIPLEKTLEAQLSEMNVQDEIDVPVDIGLPPPKTDARKISSERIAILAELENDSKLESLSRLGKHVVPLQDIKTQWKKSNAPEHIHTIADHYGIYKDLFDHGYFKPRVMMNVLYDYKEEYSSPVYMGNRLKPSDCEKAPTIQFEAPTDSWWSLMLVNPDCHFQDPTSEYLHWFVGNIPGNDMSKGEELVNYMQPFPACGTGYHRLIFVLYKQDKKLDWSSYKKVTPCNSLKDRTFKTFNFYKTHQDEITPAGLAFFQCSWDKSMSGFFRNVLNMREPIFDYDYPPAWVPKLTPYRIKSVTNFNVLLDKYRDPKHITRDVLRKRLKKITPFAPEEPPFPYPTALKLPADMPTWLKEEARKERLKIGKYKDL